MSYRVYVSSVDATCPDYRFVCDVVSQTDHQMTNLEQCDVCFFTAGTYLSGHNAPPMQAEIQEALRLQKRIVVVKPYVTHYMPLYFRRLPGQVCARHEVDSILASLRTH